MLGGMAAKWRWRARRRAAGMPTDRPNMVCGPVQVVWHKFARYWDIEMREVPMAAGRYCMTPDDMLERGRREHDRGGADVRCHLHRRVRDVAAMSRRSTVAGAHRTRRRHSRRWCERSVPGALLRARCAVRLPRCRGSNRSARRDTSSGSLRSARLGGVARHSRAARRADLPRGLPRRRHAGVPDQLLATGGPDRRPVLRVPPPRS